MTLSRPNTKAGRLQRAALDLLREHARSPDGLPTTVRFLFYELEQRGVARKPSPDDRRPNRRREVGWPVGAQDVTDAVARLRKAGLVPRSWVMDEERSLTVWSHAPSVAEYLLDALGEASLNPWGTELPPLVLCEDKATAGVLRELVVAPYLCPVAGTKGQALGFLHTEVVPFLLDDGERRVLYLGDLDRSGAAIEAHTRGVLEHALGPLDWRRIGLTEEQAATLGEPIWKVDGRDGHGHEAWEVEALGQAGVVALVRSALDALLPEPLARVREREQAEREEWRRRLEASR